MLELLTMVYISFLKFLTISSAIDSLNLLVSIAFMASSWLNVFGFGPRLPAAKASGCVSFSGAYVKLEMSMPC